MTEAGRRGRWTGSAATDKIESPGGGNAVTGRASLKFRVSSWDSRAWALSLRLPRPRGPAPFAAAAAWQADARPSVPVPAQPGRGRALTCQWLACQRAGPARH